MFASFPVPLLNPGPGGGGGGSGTVTVTASPVLQQASGPLQTHLFSTPVVITVVGGAPTAYFWFFRAINGGSWSVFSGQGTASATAYAAGIPLGGGVFAEMACSVTVGGVQYVAACQFAFTNTSNPPGEFPEN